MDGWCNIKSAAAYAGVSERTFEKLITQGLKVSRLLSGHRLTKYQWIDEFLERFAESNNKVDSIVEEMVSNFKSAS